MTVAHSQIPIISQAKNWIFTTEVKTVSLINKLRKVTGKLSWCSFPKSGSFLAWWFVRGVWTSWAHYLQVLPFHLLTSLPGVSFPCAGFLEGGGTKSGLWRSVSFLSGKVTSEHTCPLGSSLETVLSLSSPERKWAGRSPRFGPWLADNS